MAPHSHLHKKKFDSVFAADGLTKTVKTLCDEIRELYLQDAVPWVIGYSGGKDSTAIVELVWLAVRELPPDKRQKTIHVISTDTRVEQPIVAAWVDASHAKMREAAARARYARRPAQAYCRTSRTPSG